MAGKDTNYQIVYRGDYLEYFHSGGWVFFQRPKKAGGGFWLGRTYDFVFMIELPLPVSLREGIIYLQQLSYGSAASSEFSGAVTRK
ncbi:hypothetical protein [Pantoea agglomerans]|uniref:hypothetical protein n=1 Tax=Enterobacter agglomerans TaxID=549 RepID=UPI000E20CAD1|nr:hypothetical protein [Pantoea agglomerans]